MTTVRVLEERKIIIPQDISRQMGIEENDVFEIEVTSQGILLRPLHTKMDERMRKLLRFAGSGQAVINPQNPNATIEQLRKDHDTWTY